MITRDMLEALTPEYRLRMGGYLEAEIEYYEHPAAHLRAFLARVGPVVETYRRRGKVAVLADEAERQVAELEARQRPPESWADALRAYGAQLSTGCAVEPLPPPYPGAAETACNALAEELRRLQVLVEGGRAGGRQKADAHTADDLRRLRQDWERLRKTADTDTEADKMAARVEQYALYGWEAVKQRRVRDEKKNGRWRRP